MSVVLRRTVWDDIDWRFDNLTSAQVVETSVNVISNSPSQDYTHPDDRTLLYEGIWTLALKSDPRAEISGEIVWYDALAPRPEVLLSWCIVCACAGPSNSSSYHIRGNEINWVRSSEYVTVFTAFVITRASYLNMRAISLLVGWSELSSQNRPFCNHFALL